MDCRRDASELARDEPHRRVVSAGRPVDGPQVDVRGLAGGNLALIGLVRAPLVRVDERHLDALAAGSSDEEELVAVRHRLLDDRCGERCEEMSLHRPPQWPCAELGAEALLDEECVGRVV
jgi:hypothetical protein